MSRKAGPNSNPNDKNDDVDDIAEDITCIASIPTPEGTTPCLEKQEDQRGKPVISH